MKKFRFLLLFGVILVSTSLVGCGNTDTNNNDGDIIIEDATSESNAAIDYNDSLVDLASECIMSEEAIWNTYNDESATIEDIIEAVNGTIAKCTSAIDTIKNLGDFEGDGSLKDGVLNIIEKDIAYYSKFNELLPFIAQEELTEEDESKYETLLAESKVLDEELSKANDDLISIQEKFAADHGYELESPDVE